MEGGRRNAGKSAMLQRRGWIVPGKNKSASKADRQLRLRDILCVCVCVCVCVYVRVTSYTHVDIIITPAACWFRAIDLPTAPTLGGGSSASARSARRVDGLAETAACLYDRFRIVKPGEAENFFLRGTRDSAIDVRRSVVKEARSCVRFNGRSEFLSFGGLLDRGASTVFSRTWKPLRFRIIRRRVFLLLAKLARMNARHRAYTSRTGGVQ